MKPINQYISTQLDLDYAGNLAKQVDIAAILLMMAGVSLGGLFAAAFSLALGLDSLATFILHWLEAGLYYFWGSTGALMVGACICSLASDAAKSFVAWRV